MPTWNQINEELDNFSGDDPCDTTRQKYLSALSAYTGREVLAYYSGFLQKRSPQGLSHPEASITDLDMNGLMAAIHGLDRDRGLDLLLHTPGGGIEATRGIVSYLNKQFGLDVRAIVPQMAMSAGTMIACACKEIVLAKHSCLGPVDPHIRGLPALGIIAEVERAVAEIKRDPTRAAVWQQIFAKYPPAFILDCERSIAGSKKLVQAWLRSNMFKSVPRRSERSRRSVEGLTNYKKTTEHGHHFTYEKCRAIGLNIGLLEQDQQFQEAVLSVHHSYMASFARTDTIKIIENHNGARWTVKSS